MAGFFDSLFGTRSYTAGAELQLPRKVPMRVEPKSYFANERTFLAWCGMATTMGGVSSAMVGLTFSSSGSDEGGRLISKKTVDMVSVIYVPVAILMICYAMFTYEWRSKFMHKKQVGPGVESGYSQQALASLKRSSIAREVAVGIPPTAQHSTTPEPEHQMQDSMWALQGKAASLDVAMSPYGIQQKMLQFVAESNCPASKGRVHCAGQVHGAYVISNSNVLQALMEGHMLGAPLADTEGGICWYMGNSAVPVLGRYAAIRLQSDG